MRIGRTCALAFALIASTSMLRAQTDEISGPLSYVMQPFDVLHYDATIDLTRAPQPEMSGACAIRIRWQPGASTSPYFAFHLRSLIVDSVFYNGNQVFFAAVG